LLDPTFNQFGTTMTCGRQMNRHTTTAYTKLGQHSVAQYKSAHVIWPSGFQNFNFHLQYIGKTFLIF